MGIARGLIVSFLAGSVVWTVFTWPLPLHLFDGVPTSSRNIEIDGVRTMMPSDQLQLMYHYWLFQDMLAGRTPWFHNLYEFNTGSDRERFWPSAYFFPFSLLYAGFAWIGGRAFGMNMVGWLAVCATVGLTWQMVRRLGVGGAAAWAVAAVSILVPYRWVAQLGGSPGGYAMVYVPLAALGLDITVRDRRPLGGIIAGAALLLVCFGDVQVFYFLTLSLPFWVVLYLILGPAKDASAAEGGVPAPPRTFAWEWPPTGKQVREFAPTVEAWAKAFLFLLAGLMLALGYRSGMSAVMEASTMQGGRRLEEVALFSAHWRGLFSWENLGVHNHVYVGFAACALLAAGAAWLLIARRREPRALAAYLLTVAAIGGVVALALGTNGPGEGLALRAARKLIPHYDLVRQPARILCLLPTLLAVAMAIALVTVPAALRRTVALVGGVALFAEYAAQVRATVCVLEPGQDAYRAVAEDARAADRVPFALVAPLWPGDSDLSSLYQYYGSLYRIRLVNGYSPVVTRRYLNEVFNRFVSVNQGMLDDGQLNELQLRGVHHVLVHENAFPEKVSPFPIATTLCRLLDHPRLELLTQAGPVWGFRILTAPRSPGKGRHGYSYFPAPGYRDQELESQLPRGVVPIEEDPSASGGRFAVLNRDGAGIGLAKPWYTGPAKRLRWEVRLRGRGWLRVRHADGGSDREATSLRIDSPDWEWRPVPAPPGDGFRPLRLELTWGGGRIELDRAFLTGGWWPAIEPGRTFHIPAAAFFHAGYSDLDQGQVFFRQAYEPHGAILYGPQLPISPGEYVVELHFHADAEPDLTLGRLRVVQGGETTPLCDVRSGRPAFGRFSASGNLPIRLEFDYTRAADLRLDDVYLIRADEPRQRNPNR